SLAHLPVTQVVPGRAGQYLAVHTEHGRNAAVLRSQENRRRPVREYVVAVEEIGLAIPNQAPDLSVGHRVERSPEQRAQSSSQRPLHASARLLAEDDVDAVFAQNVVGLVNRLFLASMYAALLIVEHEDALGYRPA